MDFLYEPELRVGKDGRHLGIWLDGERIPSVTTVLRILDKPALKSWAWRIAVEGSAQIPPMRRTTEQQTEALIGAGYGWWQKRDVATKRGKDIHDALRFLLTEGKPPELEEWPPDQQGYVQALADYWIKEQPITLEAEVVVASRRSRYGGKIDLIRSTGTLPCPVEFKTGKPDEFGKPREPFIESHLQIAAYEHALEEQTGQVCSPGEIVSLCNNGAYEIFPGVANPLGFHQLVTAARYLKETEDAMKQWRKRQEEEVQDGATGAQGTMEGASSS